MDRIVVADDHPLFRAALRSAVDKAAPGAEVIECASLGEARAGAAAADPVDHDGGWAPRFEGRPITSFEAKSQRAGRLVFDLAYRRR